MKQKTKENLKSIRSYMINNYLISVLLILVIEVLARHSLTDGIRFVWDHPFLTLLSEMCIRDSHSVMENGEPATIVTIISGRTAKSFLISASCPYGR